MEDLEKITPESLYTYYKELLRTNLIDIFIVGDIDFNNMEKIIKDNFIINTIKKTNANHFIKQDKFRALPQIVKDSKEINQSILIVASKLKDITSFEREYVLALYNSVLGGGPDSKLFKEVREKNSLCYSISSSHSGIANLQYISAGIDEKNFDKTVKLVKKEIKKMTTGDFTDDELIQAKTTYLASLKELEDSTNGIINIYEAHEYLNYGLLEERRIEIVKVTKEDIINVSKKIHLDTIYLLKGDRHEDEAA
jgi:predicted Zn-dependent peptidase